MFLPAAAAAVLVRLAVFGQIWQVLPSYRTTIPGWDPHTYNLWAQQIAGGDLLSEGLGGAFYHAPLCPYLLAAVYLLAGKGNILAGIVMNGVFGVGSALLAAAIARRLFGDLAGLAAGLLMAANASQISVEAMLLNDPLVTGLCLAGVWFILQGSKSREAEGPTGGATPAIRSPSAGEAGEAMSGGFRRWPWLLAGVSLGLSALARASNLLPAGAMAAVVLLPCLRRRRRAGLWNAALLSAGLAAVVALPVLRNGLMFGRWTPSTNGPVMFYLGNCPGATGYFSYSPQAHQASQRVAASPDPEAAWRREIADFLRHSPQSLLKALGRKTLLFFNAWDTPDNGNYHFTRRYIWPLRWLAFDPLVLYVLGTAGVVLTWRHRRRLVPVYVFALSFGCSIILTLVSGRYKLPFLAILCLFGGAAVSVVLGQVRRRRWRALLAEGLLAAALVALYWPRGSVGFQDEEVPYRPQEFLLNAKALHSLGRTDEAMGMLQDGAALLPHDGAFADVMAQIQLSLGHPAQALKQIEQALSDPHAHGRLTALQSLMEQRVQAYQALGQPAAARQAAEELLSRFPDSQVGRQALGGRRGLGGP